jgi:protein SCO1/2
MLMNKLVMLIGTLILGCNIKIAFAQDANGQAAAQRDMGTHQHSAVGSDAPLKDKSIYNLGSVWTDQSGAKVEISSLRGQPVIAAMTYTSCKDICPLIVADMMAIEDQLKTMQMDKVRFALFSIDPEADTPSKLKAYATDRGLNETHWSLLTGDAKSVRALAAILGVRYRRLPDGQYDHSNLVTLLDADGVVVHQSVGDKQGTDDFVNAVHKVMMP